MKRISASIIAALLTLLSAGAAGKAGKVTTIKADSKCPTQFAVFIDKDSWDHCSDAVMDYRAALQEEGLGTWIFAADWQNPEQVKDLILKTASGRKALEGVVFVGDIPIVKVGGAQHLTTAFKMDEEEFPRSESWVTTDRFYDDFDLGFDFIDTDSTGFWYYYLNDKGSQHCASDIYSGRILVPQGLGEDSYAILSAYMHKAAAAHREENVLDNVIFFAGSSYNSDCLTAWNQKPKAWREYFPAAFAKASTNHFYNFRYSLDVMKHLKNELKRPGVDFFQFSEHGGEDTQYIGEGEKGHDIPSDIATFQEALRRHYKWYVRGTDKEEEFFKEALEVYHMTPEDFSDEKFAQDKADLREAAERANLHLEDIAPLQSSPRMIVFNACYNGSFHCKEGNVASYHIFNGGNTVVTQGNTVNVLQDKYEDECLGILSLGYRVGEWQKCLPYLESHIVGDPTYRFTPSEASLADEADARTVYSLRRRTIDYLDGREEPFSGELLELFRTSGSWSVRLEALSCLSYFADANCIEAVMLAFNDPYERIRRMAADLACKIADPCFTPEIEAQADKAMEAQRYQYLLSSAYMVITAEDRHAVKVLEGLQSPDAKYSSRKMNVRFLRNNPMPAAVPHVLAIVANPDEDENLRVIAAEALGWYDRSCVRCEIAASLKEILERGGLPERLRMQLAKTLDRLY